MSPNRRDFIQTLAVGVAGSSAALARDRAGDANAEAAEAPPAAVADSIWFTDMSACRPADVFSDTLSKGHWRTIEYATSERRGKLVYAGPETGAPRLTLPLGLVGWHAIYIGLWGGFDELPFAVKLKLRGEPCFHMIQKEVSSVETVEEAFFKVADLTGQDLELAQVTLTPANSAGIAYIRCQPLTDAEVAAIQQDRRQTATRRLIAFNDGEGIFRRMPSSEEDLWEFVESLADSDYAELHWGIVGERVGHPTKVARHYGEGLEDFSRVDLRSQMESLQQLLNKGINPLASVMQYAHSIGLKFFLYQRMGAFAAFPPFDEVFGSRFYQEHPEYRCQTADGRGVMRLSMAYPEVRSYMVSILQEAAEFGIDGVNLNFKRGAPFVVYDPPLVEGFRKQYGHDPRQLDEWDKTWLEYRSGAVTQLMRELRQALDRVGARLGKRLEIAATTQPSPAECLFFGLDLQTWINEGLVDNLLPMGFSHGGPEVDLEYFLGLTRGTACRFHPFLPVGKQPRNGGYVDVGASASSIRSMALKYFDQGVDGLSVWDSHALDVRSGLGPVMRRLGHIDELRAAETESKRRERKVIRLTSLGGCDVTVRVPTDEQRLYPHGTPHHAWTGL